ncbi:MAG TPA: FtsX-like permease family protein [Candidatus Pelagibacter bacterium]|jgi:ABC-type lipoprotein release transport system permease subunit|nr:FtsX-like permease family protein [Candidatus Pelagibacter bacterium]
MRSNLLLISKIGWRSIWRNKRRTLISLFSIIIGTGIPIFFVCIAWGFYAGLIDDVARLMSGHITYEHVEYRNSPSNDLWVEDIQKIDQTLNNNSEILTTKQIVNLQGVAHTAKGSVGISLMGVEPEKEIAISFLPENIIKGKYLSKGDERWVVVGQKLAKNLNIDIGKKFVFTTNNVDGELTEELFRVKGVFKTGSKEIDGHFVQSDIEIARKVAGLSNDDVSQLGIIVKNPDNHENFIKDLQKSVTKNNGVFLSWQKIMPDVATTIRMDRTAISSFMIMLVVIVLFTMFSTILMSTLERRREFASLLAIGTQQIELKIQILLETIFFGLIACPLGVLLGISLAKWVEGYDMMDMFGGKAEDMTVGGFGMDTIITPLFSAPLILQISIFFFFAVQLLSILPIYLISRISITDELRSI